MKRDKLSYTIMLFIMLVGSLCACKDQNDIEKSSDQATNLSIKNDLINQIITTAEATSEIALEVVNEYTTNEEQTLVFDYEIGHNESVINLNIPDGWLLDYENTTNAQLTTYTLSNTQLLSISGATEQAIGWFTNYHNNGVWADTLWEIALDDFSELETPYGNVEVVTGVSAISGLTYHLCLLNASNTYWYIEERITNADATEEPATEIKSIAEILNEMFTGKPMPNTENSLEENYVEDHINIIFQGNEYEYYIEKPDWSKNNSPIIKILGFNLPENFDKITVSEASSDDAIWNRAYFLENSTSVHGTMDRIVIDTVSGTYLQDYNKTNQFTAGTKYQDRYGVLFVEKKEVIDTPYGQLQIFYQVVEDMFDGFTKELETAICYVNGETITIDLSAQYILSEELHGYTGELLDHLLQMFTTQ